MSSDVETPRRKFIPIYQIPDDIKALADVGVAALLRKLELRPGDVDRALTGTKPLEQNSVQAYQKHLRGTLEL
jgi:hypothetical protein